MEYFNRLPEEITLGILSRVPTETVIECKLVCRNWGSLVSQNPTFSNMHTKHHLDTAASDSGKSGFIAWTYSDRKKYHFQYFEYNENHESTAPPIDRIRRINFIPRFRQFTRFIGSCNGLVCLSGRHSGQKFYICNPITRECVRLPEIKKAGKYPGASGFGYVASTNEYKVVTIVFKDGTESMEVYVYTLGSGQGWRSLGNFNLGTSEEWEEDGIFVNGVLYWLDDELEMIVAFDLAEEKFCGHLSLPLPPEDDFDDHYELGVLDGCLSFTAGTSFDGDLCRDMWLLKKKNDNDGIEEREGDQSLGWSEVFNVYDSPMFAMFAITKSCDVLTYSGNQINIHLSEASTSKTILDFEERFIGVFPHKNTLVSLRELGEQDTKMMESVEIAETESHDQPFNQP